MLLVLGLRLGAALGGLLGCLLLLLGLLLDQNGLPRRAALVDKGLDRVDRVVVVDALAGGQVALGLFVLAEVAVGGAAHAERLGRIGVERKRLVAVADRRVGLLHLQVRVGALRVHEGRRRQLDDLGEGGDGLGVVTVACRLRRLALELADLVHVRVGELAALRRAHLLRRVRVGRHQVGVGVLGRLGLVGLRLALLGLVLVPMLVRVAMVVGVAVVLPGQDSNVRTFRGWSLTDVYGIKGSSEGRGAQGLESDSRTWPWSAWPWSWPQQSSPCACPCPCPCSGSACEWLCASAFFLGKSGILPPNPSMYERKKARSLS